MKRFLILACVITALYTAVVRIPSVSAQTCLWSKTFDFSVGLQDWEIEYGSYDGELQPEDFNSAERNGVYREIRINYDLLTTDSTFTDVSLTYHMDKGKIYSPASPMLIINGDTQNLLLRTFGQTVETPPTAPLTVVENDLSISGQSTLEAAVVISLWYTEDPQWEGDGGLLELTFDGFGSNPFTGEICNMDELMLPVKDIDSLQRDNVSEGDSQFIYIASDDYGAAVHAGVDGIIASVRPSLVSCVPFSNSDPFLYSKFCGGNMDSETLAVNAGEVYFVEIESTQTLRRYTYVVKNAPLDAMFPGASVSAGCLIGYTFQTQSGPSVNQFGIAAVYVTDSQDYSLLEQFTVDLVPNDSCFKEPGYNECMGDYDLEDPSQWNVTGTPITAAWGTPFNNFETTIPGPSPEFGDSTVKLNPGSTISGWFNLDFDRNPQVVVKARRNPPWAVNNVISIEVGDATDFWAVPENWGRHEFSPAPSTIGVGGITKVKLRMPQSIANQLGLVDWWEIDYICVRHTTDENGDPLPPPDDIGDPGSPDNDDPIPPDFEFDFTCDYLEAPNPATATVQEWLAWHGDNFLTTYNCAVLPALVRIVDYLSYILDELVAFFNDVREAIETFLDAIRYMMVLAYLGSDWVAADVVPFFAGYLSNIAPTEITFNAGSGDTTCAAFDVFCFISNIFGEGFDFGSDVLDLLRQLFEEFVSPILNLVIGWVDAALFSGVKILVGLVSLAVRVVGEILQFFQMGTDIIFGLVGMWNTATPQTLPGMWDCTVNPQANGICWGLWVAENTVFSGPVGSLIIPLIVSVLYILVALNYVRIIRKMVADIGSSI